MWKFTSRNFKSIFWKNQCLHNSIATREARNDRNCSRILKFTPSLLNPRHRSFADNHTKYGPSSKDEKERPKTDKGNYLNDFNDGLIEALRLSGIFVVCWYILHPFSHKKGKLNEPQSEKCTLNILSKYTCSKCLNLVNYFTESFKPYSGILPIVEAARQKKVESYDNECETDAERYRELEKAHEIVLGSLNNLQGAECMQKGRYSEGIIHFQNGAELDNPSATFNLGLCHEMGLGTNQDFNKAAELYKKASDLGHATATYNLGVYYVHGIGDLEVDLNQARNLFELAASLGQPNAKQALNLGNKDINEISDSKYVEEKSGSSNRKEESLMNYTEDYQLVDKPNRKSKYHGSFSLLYELIMNGIHSEGNRELTKASPLEDSGAYDISAESYVIA